MFVEFGVGIFILRKAHEFKFKTHEERHACHQRLRKIYFDPEWVSIYRFIPTRWNFVVRLILRYQHRWTFLFIYVKLIHLQEEIVLSFKILVFCSLFVVACCCSNLIPMGEKRALASTTRCVSGTHTHCLSWIMRWIWDWFVFVRQPRSQLWFRYGCFLLVF